jgi:hypothetical protein
VKLELSLLENFGSHLADGSEAYSFRITKIDPYIAMHDEVVLDFTGIRNANSSFMNALVAGLIAQHGISILKKICFKGCNPLIKVLVGAAVDLGVQKNSGGVPA